MGVGKVGTGGAFRPLAQRILREAQVSALWDPRILARVLGLSFHGVTLAEWRDTRSDARGYAMRGPTAFRYLVSPDSHEWGYRVRRAVSHHSLAILGLDPVPALVDSLTIDLSLPDEDFDPVDQVFAPLEIIRAEWARRRGALSGIFLSPARHPLLKTTR